MTVKELFNNVDFDDVAAALLDIFRYDEPSIDLASYKKAFDYICQLESNSDGEIVTFEAYPREIWNTASPSIPLIATCVENSYWDTTAGRTVVFPEDDTFKLADFACAILWGMTFHGFSNRKHMFLHNECHSKFGIRAQELERRLYVPYLRDKKEQKELKKPLETLASAMRHPVALSFKKWKQINFRQKHQNKSKWKRRYRMENRIRALKELDAKMDYLNGIKTSIGENYTHELHEKFFFADSIVEYFCESRPYVKLNRVDSLKKELSDEYNPAMWSICFGYDDLIIIVTAPSNRPVTDNEYDNIKTFFEESIVGIRLKLQAFRGIDDSDDTELTLRIFILRQPIDGKKNIR